MGEQRWQFVDGDLSYCEPQGTGLDCDDIPQWAPGEPNNGYGDQDCAQLYSSGTLYDAGCHVLKPYICEFDANTFAYKEVEVVGAGADQPSYFVFEVTGLEGTGTLMLFSAMMLCIVCLSCLLCKSYLSARAKTKGYGKVVMDTDSEL